MNYLNTLNYGNKMLRNNNISSYQLDSELLLAKVLNKTREEILINLKYKLEDKQLKKFKKLLIRRKRNEP